MEKFKLRLLSDILRFPFKRNSRKKYYLSKNIYTIATFIEEGNSIVRVVARGNNLDCEGMCFWGFFVVVVLGLIWSEL